MKNTLMKRRSFLTWMGLGWLASTFPILVSTIFARGKNRQESLAQTQPLAQSEQLESFSFYVAPNGNDKWSGKLANPNGIKTDGPFATIVRARGAIRQLKRQQGGSLQQSVTVFLRDGTYNLTKPLVFTPEDSGSEDYPVTYTAYDNEKPIISGGRRVSNWEETTINGKSVWVADLPAVKSGNWYFRNLWVNEERRYRARYPNEGYLSVYNNAPGWNAKNWRQPTKRFFLNPSDLQAWNNLNGAEAVVGARWQDQHLPIQNLNLKTGLLVSKLNSFIRIDRGYPLYLENSIDFLDSPGEWYLDRGNGRLYYYPKSDEDRDSVEVVAPALRQLIILQGSKSGRNPSDISYQFVENIKFEGLTFSFTDWQFPAGYVTYAQASVQTGAWRPDGKRCAGVIFGEGVQDCTWEDCTVSHVGSWGIDLWTGCQNNTISNCEVYDLGAGGIRIGQEQLGRQPFSKDFESHSNQIIDCNIYECGRIFHGATGIWIGQARNNLVSRNRVRDLYYSGISVGWSWGYFGQAKDNVIELNEIHHIGRQTTGELPFLNDLGGIYTLGLQPGTIVRSNLIHDVDAYNYGGWGIYLDEGSSEIVLENNLVYQTRDGGFHLHYGKENIIRNNIFAFGQIAQIRRSRNENHLSFTFENNIVYWDTGKLLEGKWDNYNYFFDRNLYWQVGGGEILFNGLSWNEWQARGMDKNSLIAEPEFADPEEGDFELQPDSPAFELGFQAIQARLMMEK